MSKSQETRIIRGLTYANPILFALTVVLIALYAEATHNVTLFTLIFLILTLITLILNHVIYRQHKKLNQPFNKTLVLLMFSQSLIVIGLIAFFVPFLV